MMLIRFDKVHTYIAQTDRQTQTYTDRHRHTQTDTDRHRQTPTDTDRHRQTQTNTDRHRQTRIDTDRHRQTDIDESAVALASDMIFIRHDVHFFLVSFVGLLSHMQVSFQTSIGLCYIDESAVASASDMMFMRFDKIMGLFCRISSLLQGSFAKETYYFSGCFGFRHDVHRV